MQNSPAERDRSGFEHLGMRWGGSAANRHSRTLPFLLLLCCLLVPGPASCTTYQEICLGKARKWIEETGIEDSSTLQKHTATRCQFVDNMLSSSANETADRERVCTDLVLLWTRKDCVFFRDYVSYRTYAPCMAWGREMFKECVGDGEK